jgi:antitoxin FitA
MTTSCYHAHSMTRMVQVKGVPEGVHRTLKARAALRGQTLSDYLRAEMERLAARPSADELLALLDRDAPEALGDSAAPEVRRSRERSA